MTDVIWGTVKKIISTNSFSMDVSHQKDTNQDSYKDIEEIQFTEIDIPSIPADENSRNVSEIEQNLKDKFVKLSPDDLPREDSDIKPEVSDAYDALLALGFQMKDIRKAISKVQNRGKDFGAEEMIKQALKELR